MRWLVLLALLPGCFLFRGGGGTHCQPGRTVEIGLQEDIAKFAGCEQASSLTIRTGATIDVTPLKELEVISGDLSIGPTVGVDSVSFNGLVRVGGTIRITSNGSLRGMFMPRLEEVGRIEIEGNAVLSSISLPHLVRVKGAVVITDNYALELISASSLVSVGKELVISGHPKLNLLELPRLATLETIRLENNPVVPPEAIEQLMAKVPAP